MLHSSAVRQDLQDLMDFSFTAFPTCPRGTVREPHGQGGATTHRGSSTEGLRREGTDSRTPNSLPPFVVTPGKNGLCGLELGIRFVFRLKGK
jgi:hypothetical protein